MKGNLCNDETYQSVFYKFSEGLRNFIFYKSGNLTLSEDIVQDAFVKLWQNCSTVELEKVKSYLFTVANNLFLNKVKHQNVVLKFEQKPQKIVDEQSPHYLLEEKEFEQKLTKAISKLPENQRTVFLMHRIDKKKYREIAEEQNISIKTVEKRMHLALLALRKIHKKV